MVLGGLAGVLGVSLAVLGGLGAVLGGHGWLWVVLSSTRCGERADLSSKKEPRWHPNRNRKQTKIDIKNGDGTRSSKGGLGAILKRCWVVSNGLLGVKKGEKHWKP